MSIEDRLARIKELERAPLSASVTKKLGKALSGANNVLVAKAARVVERRGIADLIPSLVTAFDRFIGKPANADKGCLAKIAIVEALNGLDHNEEEVFLRGIHHVQKEAVFTLTRKEKLEL